ncbi:hypothetical protein TUM20983_50130 [Mycobacterium antarcticum]|uniref:hypothetical protein n=1 Tax=Mycolicibacterium sp. TUM20983 TaxID=3023369 RepID=UPI00238414E5|nr:hypothetical protein [Mycolicibacterium sp. TUM20983]GLP77903.1 hypothetical protein TUM20983_50130 [Mycolicibacterium sp. TUM20983]
MKLVVTRTLTMAAAMTALAVGLASPSVADPPLLNGTFSGGDSENMWTIATTCTATACTGSVASNQGWTVPAVFANGVWNFKVTKPDGVICDDGSYAPAYISMTLDPVTLAGTITTDSNYGCPGGNVNQEPFQLRQV